jgi:hypothetical protein
LGQSRHKFTLGFHTQGLHLYAAPLQMSEHQKVIGFAVFNVQHTQDAGASRSVIRSGLMCQGNGGLGINPEICAKFSRVIGPINNPDWPKNSSNRSPGFWTDEV